MFSRNFGMKTWWWIVGTYLASVAGWTLLSFHFEYGQGHRDRPILMFLTLFFVTFGCFVAALRLQWKKGGPGITVVIAVALTARLILLPSNLILENDVYRYVHDGQLLLHGGNPYTTPPAETKSAPPTSLAGSVATHGAQETLDRISYTWIASPYPPVAQFAFAAGVLFSGWNWIGQRLVFLLFDLLLLLLLIRTLKKLGRPPEQVLLYAWNPLILKEIANSVHVDVLAGLLLVLAGIALLHYEERPTLKRLASVAVCFSGATLSKLYPLILLPAILFWLWRRSGIREVVFMTSFTVLSLVAAYAPFFSTGWEETLSGLMIYARRWQMNEGIFGLIDFLMPAPRLVLAGVVVAVAVAVPVFGKGRTAEEILRQCGWVLVLVFLLLPSPFPWYAIPAIALVTAVGGSATPAVAALSGLFGLYYLSFYFEYHSFATTWWTWTKVIEHGAIWGLIAWSCIRSNRPSAYGAETQGRG